MIAATDRLIAAGTAVVELWESGMLRERHPFLNLCADAMLELKTATEEEKAKSLEPQ